jgi:hypothetical protein
MRRLPVKTSRARGFSLIELMIVTLILMTVFGLVMTYIRNAQRRFDAEQTKIDMTQETREFMDSIARDLHMAGYPHPRMYTLGAVPNPWWDNQAVATGIVSVSSTQLLLEGDVDGDGRVDAVRYQLVADDPAPPGIPVNCPCRIQRGVRPKQNAATPAPLNQPLPSFYVEAQGVINSGGTIGLGPVGLGNFAPYIGQPVFQAYDVSGAPIALPVTLNDINPVTGQPRVFDIRTIRITLSVLGAQPDNQTRVRPVMNMSTTAGINNY